MPGTLVRVRVVSPGRVRRVDAGAEAIGVGAAADRDQHTSDSVLRPPFAGLTLSARRLPYASLLLGADSKLHSLPLHDALE